MYFACRNLREGNKNTSQTTLAQLLTSTIGNIATSSVFVALENGQISFSFPTSDWDFLAANWEKRIEDTFFQSEWGRFSATNYADREPCRPTPPQLR